ncbi:ATP synthase subunit beta [Iodidimonas gelatinilytica]|uniref:ATP synthase subunit beta n=1 Tax=Iodidimonas gelatinilytica TaxID=1236966 RepID=A0A5A7MSC5_9PROT|nr:SAM-dependent methyltransferase [Iodidimonas gelatinilytica]GEQ97779.1 ATP synthase subunit beta [Iodidimonas gelatinilytica]
MTTPLSKHLHALINATGPISVHRYMSEALMHPDHGYYRKRDPLGAKGDFITAPEISQIFGELLGLWLADRWEAMGRPDPVRLVELGPGRGTLMADAVRAMAVVPGLAQALDIHLVESNEALRKAQGKKVKAQWHDRFADVPEGPTLLVANEFFDALPIYQFVRTASGWAERHVTSDGKGFDWCLGPASAQAALIPETLQTVEEGALVELCPAALSITDEIAKRINSHGGAALIIDYGYDQSAAGETLQAIRRHQRVDVFHKPGESDLTAHVNFDHLSQVAQQAGAQVEGPVTQGDFLRDLGIEIRAALLCRRATEKQACDIKAAVRRLTAPDMMGILFKAMAIQPGDGPTVEAEAETSGAEPVQADASESPDV